MCELVLQRMFFCPACCSVRFHRIKLAICLKLCYLSVDRYKWMDLSCNLYESGNFLCLWKNVLKLHIFAFFSFQINTIVVNLKCVWVCMSMWHLLLIHLIVMMYDPCLKYGSTVKQAALYYLFWVLNSYLYVYFIMNLVSRHGLQYSAFCNANRKLKCGVMNILYL